MNNNSFSYSRVDTHNVCPYKYKLRYVDKLDTLFDEKPTNALCLGTACHEGIETRSIEKAIEVYKSKYSIWGDENELEVHKLTLALEKAIKNIPEGEYEHKLLADDGFIGFIDELVKNDDGTYTMYDFKYSNNADGYKHSGQLHLYKYYYEKLTGNKIKDMYYILVPKATKTLKESITEELSGRDLTFIPIEFDPKQISYFFARKAIMDKDDKAGSYEKRHSFKCKWCEYYKYCVSRGSDVSELTQESRDKLGNGIKEVSLFNE